MKSVAVCGSRRFKKEMMEWVKYLKKEGITVFEPFLNEKPLNKGNIDSDFLTYIYNGLTRHHLDAIRKADVALFFNPGGYVGVSTTIELGVAVALGKTVVALEHDFEDQCRECLFDFFTTSSVEFAHFLKGSRALSPR